MGRSTPPCPRTPPSLRQNLTSCKNSPPSVQVWLHRLVRSGQGLPPTLSQPVIRQGAGSPRLHQREPFQAHHCSLVHQVTRRSSMWGHFSILLILWLDSRAQLSNIQRFTSTIRAVVAVVVVVAEVKWLVLSLGPQLRRLSLLALPPPPAALTSEYTTLNSSV